MLHTSSQILVTKLLKYSDLNVSTILHKNLGFDTQLVRTYNLHLQIVEHLNEANMLPRSKSNT